MHDAELRGNQLGKTVSQKNVKALYENAPYPDLGAALKDPSGMIKDIIELLGCGPDKQLNYLEAGCGTGHYLVAVAKTKPFWTCKGVDLSSASLDIAQKLSSKHGVSIEVHQKSYLDLLPFNKNSFDVISAQGTIHHSDNPVGALLNLKKYLKNGGLISMHLYGKRLDSGKFDLKELISLFQPKLNEHSDRFRIYEALINHQTTRDTLKKLLDTSLLDILRWARLSFHNIFRRANQVSWSPPWTDTYTSPTSPWKDHFCHPCERAYEVPDIYKLVSEAGLEIIKMSNQGRVDIELVPKTLRNEFLRLSVWEQWRFMELMGPPRSFVIYLKKTSSE